MTDAVDKPEKAERSERSERVDKGDKPERVDYFACRPIPRLDKDIVKDTRPTRGRKRKFTPTKMKNAINGYFAWVEENNEVPSIKGMMIHLKMYRDQFYVYLGYPEFAAIMEHARLIISNHIEADIYRTPGACQGKVNYAGNVLDWSSKSEVKSTVTQTIVSVDQARAKIEMLAPKLLELLKNSSLVNQLLPDTVEAEFVK